MQEFWSTITHELAEKWTLISYMWLEIHKNSMFKQSFWVSVVRQAKVSLISRISWEMKVAFLDLYMRP